MFLFSAFIFYNVWNWCARLFFHFISSVVGLFIKLSAPWIRLHCNVFIFILLAHVWIPSSLFKYFIGRWLQYFKFVILVHDHMDVPIYQIDQTDWTENSVILHSEIRMKPTEFNNRKLRYKALHMRMLRL